jgi:hypothetical protein
MACQGGGGKPLHQFPLATFFTILLRPLSSKLTIDHGWTNSTDSKGRPRRMGRRAPWVSVCSFDCNEEERTVQGSKQYAGVPKHLRPDPDDRKSPNVSGMRRLTSFCSSLTKAISVCTSTLIKQIICNIVVKWCTVTHPGGEEGV